MKPKALDTELTVEILVRELLRDPGLRLLRPHDDTSSWTPSTEDNKLFVRLVRFVKRGNVLKHEEALYPLKPYLSRMRWRQWCDYITEVRLSPWLIPPNRVSRGLPRSMS
jgi:hypothetical protein